MGRHAFFRRHSHDRAAADRAAVRRQDCARTAGSVFGAVRSQALRDREELLADAARAVSRQQAAGSRNSGRRSRQVSNACSEPARLHRLPARRRRHGFRDLVAEVRSRWVYSEHGAAGEDCFAETRHWAQPASRACATQPAGRHFRTRLSHRSINLRRTLRQQRLAAGTAEAADESHLGQRRAGQSEHRAATGRTKRQRRRRKGRDITSTR